MPLLRPALDDAAYHGLAGEIVRAIKPHTESDPVGLLISLLTGFGVAVGPGPHALVDSAEHPPRLYAVLVGPTADGRKGTAWANARRVLEPADSTLFERDRVLGGFGSGEALVDAVRDASDDGGAPPDKRLLVYESEFARVLKIVNRDGSILSPVVRDAWDGGKLQVRSRKLTAVATGAHVAALGHITAEELRRHLAETETANGFANRWLFVEVQRSQLLPEGGNLTDETVQALGAKLAERITEARSVGRMERTEAAKERWAELYRCMADDKPGGLLAAVVSRAEAQVLRLSVAYALFDGSDAIDLPHLEAAWALWSYCRTSAEHIFGNALGDPVADRLLRALREAHPEGLNGTAQRGLFANHARGRELEAARRQLAEQGLASTVKEETGGRDRLVTSLVCDGCDRCDEAT